MFRAKKKAIKEARNENTKRTEQRSLNNSICENEIELLI